MKKEPGRKVENPLPTIGAPDQESPEAVKARLHAWHKENGTLGVFYELYGERREHRQELRDALDKHIEASERGQVHEPAPDFNPSRGLQR